MQDLRERDHRSRGPTSLRRQALPTLSAGPTRPQDGVNLALDIRSRRRQRLRADAARALPAESGRRSVPGSRRVRAARAGRAQAADRPGTGAARRRGRWRAVVHGARRRADRSRSARQKLVDKLMPLAKNADVHIWNERLGGWKPPADVPEDRRRDLAPARAAARRRRCRARPAVPRRRRFRRWAGVGRVVACQPARKPTAPHARRRRRSVTARAGRVEAAAAGRRSSRAGRARRAEHGARSVVAARDAGAAAAHARRTPANGQKTNGVGGVGHARAAASRPTPTSCRCSTCRAGRRPRPARRRA